MPDPCQNDLTDELIPKIPLSGLYHFLGQDVSKFHGCGVSADLLGLPRFFKKNIAWDGQPTIQTTAVIVPCQGGGQGGEARMVAAPFLHRHFYPSPH